LTGNESGFLESTQARRGSTGQMNLLNEAIRPLAQGATQWTDSDKYGETSVSIATGLKGV